MSSLGILLLFCSVFVTVLSSNDLLCKEARDKDHLRDHLGEIVDLDKMSPKELEFHYFKVHDTEGNNKLDGCELVQSLLHFHMEESSALGKPGQTTKIFSDAELEFMIDPIMAMEDKNLDGYIDYTEFVVGQKRRNEYR
ncbi:multiple coagulation factor deficiency protein 2 homolog [Uloborus diversus]|uniref:multiple coagulation factor deficiency protein 2 homolog n=1 Tax=Uloborus diversus TaxID=327109 RepID=UPI00240A9C3E|nr:multiple coagulation factor deficiency protein 2 homolog [Uloborus diversus]